MNVTVCVEGGGDASTLKRKCRKGFSDFFRKAGLSGRMPRIIAGGTRVSDDNAHLMVQCMEAWFLADRETLAGFFGTGFQSSALPGRTDVENVSKKRLIDALHNATRRCRPKGRYDKGRHSFQLLGQLDPAKVTKASPYAKRLVRSLTSKASEG